MGELFFEGEVFPVGGAVAIAAVVALLALAKIASGDFNLAESLEVAFPALLLLGAPLLVVGAREHEASHAARRVQDPTNDRESIRRAGTPCPTRPAVPARETYRLGDCLPGGGEYRWGPSVTTSMLYATASGRIGLSGRYPLRTA